MAFDRPCRSREGNAEGGEIDRQGEGDQERLGEPIDDDEGRRHQHQDHVEWQDVEVAELMGQEHDAHLRARRVLEERGSVVPIQEERVFREVSGRGEQRERKAADQDVRGIDLDRPAAQPERQGRRAVAAPAARDQQSERPAREEHEQLRRIGNRKIAVREALVIDARDVVDEDRNERKAAPEVDDIGFTGHAGLDLGEGTGDRPAARPPAQKAVRHPCRVHDGEPWARP
jgi:hypothetical protein